MSSPYVLFQPVVEPVGDVELDKFTINRITNHTVADNSQGQSVICF